ncbi:hypothetical protein HanRHA438_Chr17g0793331 [Helianthus annuus]|nr:hypothetical protein HanRHA438_Chr17g0793331 [Helianthus annuus]
MHDFFLRRPAPLPSTFGPICRCTLLSPSVSTHDHPQLVSLCFVFLPFRRLGFGHNLHIVFGFGLNGGCGDRLGLNGGCGDRLRLNGWKVPSTPHHHLLKSLILGRLSELVGRMLE